HHLDPHSFPTRRSSDLTSSRFLTAAPLPSDASSNSPARRKAIVFSERLAAASTNQRIARAVRRDGRTSIGTWYVAPPTRRAFTSTIGRTFSRVVSKNSTGSTL